MSLAAQWANNVVEYTFSLTGRTVKLRPLTGYVLMHSEKVPDSLTPIVADILSGHNDEAQKNKHLEVLNEDRGIRDFYSLSDWIIEYMFVEPKVVDNPTGEGEIGYSDVEDAERYELLYLVGKAAKQLESFRLLQAKSLERMVNGQGIAPTSE